MNEVRQVLRALRKSPGYVTIATLLLGLGLGVNATLFSLIHTMLFKPLGGVERANSLVLIGQTSGGNGFNPMSFPHVQTYTQRNQTLQDLAAFRPMQSSLVRGEEALVVTTEMVTGNYFSLLETPLAAGRFFREDDDTVGTTELTAVISERLWDRLWRRSPEAVGSRVVINGHPFTIIGVAGDGFRGAVLPSEVELWIPFAFEPVFRPQAAMLTNPDFMWVRAIGRLREGSSEAAAQADLDGIAAYLRETYPDAGNDLGIRVWSYHPFPSPAGFRAASQFLGILAGVAMLVLIVVCANLSNLMLARASARQREMAIRTALGARRGRLLRLLLIEGATLAMLGLVASLTFSSWAATMFVNLIPGDNNAPLNLSVEPDLTVAAAAALLALTCTMLFAALPAWLGSSVNLLPALRSGDSTASPRRSRIRAATLVVQVALCCLLLVGAGLLQRSVQELRAIDPGLNIERLLLAELNVGLSGYDEARALSFYRVLLDRLHALSGVQSAALGMVVPLGTGGFQLGPIYGGTINADKPLFPDSNPVSDGYFRTMAIPVLAGRDFQPTDTMKSRPVVVVNETLARTLWPEGDALGKLLMRDQPGGPKEFEVVGIARDIRYRGLQDVARPFVYWSLAQQPELSQTIHLRTTGEPLAALAELRALLREMDPTLALGHIDTMEQQVEHSFWIARLAGMAVSFCGLLGVLIACLGLYGVVSYEVTRQTREIGVRMALGASATSVVRAIVRNAVQVASLGIAIGLGLAALLGNFLASMLFGVTPWDPISFLAAGIFLLVATLVACAIPAWRATRIQPISALRME
ncbi:MAG: ABC transporter permease [Bryobacterales bacterium]|nr:ABC transporter permease [Bryobacterales bacterium]